jgi:carbonic anhydrase
MQPLQDGISRFQKDVLPGLADHFADLANGQSPDVLFVTCSDSRIDPSLITQTNPGELFILRNAGNLVPRYGEDFGSASAIEYAVSALRVSHVVVCGHSGCGAIGGLLKPASLESLPAVAQWVQHASPVVEATEHLHDCSERTAAAVEHNVLLQLENLRSHPSVAAAIEEGRLHLHGWVYDIPSGDIARVTAPAGQESVDAK